MARIYVASLTDYNAGILHGEWIPVDTDVEIVQDAIDDLLSESPTSRRTGEVVEEWAVHDFSGFGPVHLTEHEPLERVCAIANGITRHGEAYAAWLAAQDDADPTDAAAFEEAYQGEFVSIEEYGEQLLDDLGADVDELPGVPEALRPYVTIDVEGWVRDMQIGGDIFTAESKAGVYVFLSSW